MSYVEELFNLDDKVAAVMGGSGVLGGSMACALAKAGAKVAIVDISTEGARQHVETIEKDGGEAVAIKADASSKAELARARDAIVAQWGGVHILLYAPGVNSSTPVLEIPEEEWDKIMSVNLKGMFLASQVFGEFMIKQNQGGSIIVISSASSIRPLSKVFTYSISKYGLNALTRFLGREWAPHGIRVNAIAPGFFPAEQNRRILTEERKAAILGHTPMARYGEPEELSGVVVWLASEKASSFVTGAVISVDGGFTAMTI
ncbi:MAG: SDR family oxidoreductase [Fidelibacterota bacterium]|nr:MAG: SDR family oxidoreductase [Candidatus Neomarinimicrobiota bacterium]